MGDGYVAGSGPTLRFLFSANPDPAVLQPILFVLKSVINCNFHVFVPNKVLTLIIVIICCVVLTSDLLKLFIKNSILAYVVTRSFTCACFTPPPVQISFKHRP